MERCPQDGTILSAEKSLRTIAFEPTTIGPIPKKSTKLGHIETTKQPIFNNSDLDLAGEASTIVQPIFNEETLRAQHQSQETLRQEETRIQAAPEKSASRDFLEESTHVGTKPTAIAPLPNQSKDSIQDENTNIRRGVIDLELGPGVQLGEYLIESFVGVGGMGEIWRGLQPQISKSVAIKVLRGDLSSNEVAVARFLQEARSVNEIKHRNIVDIFSFGEISDGRPYFVMEYLEGKTVGQYIQDHGPLPFSEIVSIFTQLCRALQAVHDHGIVHRDLKPDNIFLLQDESGEPFVKILDFGVAKLMAPESKGLTRAGAMLGTPAYMSPEQCEGAKKVDHRTDIYALGILLFELMTGRTPYEEPSDGSGLVLVKQMSMDTPAPSTMVQNREIPAAVDQFAMLLLEKDPNDRPPRCADLTGSLLRAVGEKRYETWEQLQDPAPIYSGGVGAIKKKPSKSSQQGDYYSGASPIKPTMVMLRRFGWPMVVVAFMLFGILIGGYLQKPVSAVLVTPESKPQPTSQAPTSIPAATMFVPTKEPTPTPPNKETEQPPQSHTPKEAPVKVIDRKSYARLMDTTVQKINFSVCKKHGSGKVSTKLTINIRGKVTQASTIKTKFGECVAGILKKTKFPAGSNAYTYLYPIYVD
jgi:serine/threonine protein kinase